MFYKKYIDLDWVYYFGIEHPAFWRNKYIGDKVYLKAMPGIFNSKSIYVWRDSILACILRFTVKPIMSLRRQR